MRNICIIFDLDGTLVDSEGLCNQALIDLLPELNESIETLTNRYRGKKLAGILSDIAIRLARPLPSNFEHLYRLRVAELFEHALKPTPGTPEMLEQISHSRCVASSGPPDKIAHALKIAGLAKYFGDNTYSSYKVGSWKPEPGLFLHAAKSMGFSVDQCVVVEDSETGLAAAHGAGIRSLYYSPSGQSHPLAYANFDHMRELSQIIDEIRFTG